MGSKLDDDLARNDVDIRVHYAHSSSSAEADHDAWYGRRQR